MNGKVKGKVQGLLFDTQKWVTMRRDKEYQMRTEKSLVMQFLEIMIEMLKNEQSI